MKTNTILTTESIGKMIFTAITLIVLFIIILYFRFSLSGGSDGKSAKIDHNPTHTILLTETWSEKLPVNIHAWVKEEVWTEVCIINGGKEDGNDLVYTVPPKSRKVDWHPPECIGTAYKFRLSPGKNTKKESKLFYFANK